MKLPLAILSQRFHDRFIPVPESGCWLWEKASNQDGYGHIWNGETVVYAHRVSYELIHGPIPDVLFIDHICCVPTCVNPSHLRLVTPSESLRIGKRRNVSQCKNGHLYTPSNTYINSNGQRECLICKRTRGRR